MLVDLAQRAGRCGPRRVLELFAGIGGLACAWPEATITAAVDINLRAAEVYRRNLPHDYWIREIDSLATAQLAACRAEVWWLSPPCQPFTCRGVGRDVGDARSAALLRIIDAIGELRPPAIGLENVLGFIGSQAQRQLFAALEAHGYHVRWRKLCPSELGWPNRRPRFYLLAAQHRLPPWRRLPVLRTTLAQLLGWSDSMPLNSEAEAWMLPEEVVQRYEAGLDRVDPWDPHALTACFASSYGKTLLHAGSYVRCGGGYRRFSPTEIAQLLGFSDRFCLSGLSPRSSWKLLGNSLSLPAVRYIVSHLEPWVP